MNTIILFANPVNSKEWTSGKAEKTNGLVFLFFQTCKKVLRDPIVGCNSLVEKAGGMKLHFQTLKGMITWGIGVTCMFPGLWFQVSELVSLRWSTDI